MPGERTSVYLAADLAAAVKASGIPLAELVRRGLTASTAPGVQAEPAAPAAAPSLTALPDGEPSPGVLCMGPGCWERSTSRFGLRQLPLCPACRAALEGRSYQREVPESAARLIRRRAG